MKTGGRCAYMFCASDVMNMQFEDLLLENAGRSMQIPKFHRLGINKLLS